MSVQKLTKRVIEALKPLESSEFWVWDSEVKGFGVRVKPSGAKSFLIQYRTRQGMLRKYTLGPTSLLSVEEARTKASRLLLEVKEGQDPAHRKSEDRKARSLNEVWEAYVQGYLDPKNRKVKEITKDSYVALYDRHVRNDLGKRPIESINEEDLKRLHSSLSATPYSANRTIAALSSCWTYTFGKRQNPCIGLERFAEEEVDRRLSAEDLARLGQSLNGFSAIEGRLPSLAPFFLLTALTGTRKGEWLSAKWRMIDWENGILWLDDSKTGAKPVEIPDLALQVLEFVRDRARALGELDPDSFIFPGRMKGRPLVNPYKAWKMIREAAKLPELRIHDLRHLFGTVSHRSGATQRTVAMLLGHSQLKTTERYIHGYNEDRKRAASITADAIAKAMKLPVISETDEGVEVLPRDEAQTDGTVSERPSKRPLQRKKPAR